MTDDTKALVERLRGIYRVPITDGLGTAGGDEPNNQHEFVRRFETPPISKEAANAIELLTARAEAAERERDEALAPVAWLYFNEDVGSEISYVHPINSGEVPDATDIRPIRDRAAVECICDAWDCLRSERAEALAALAAAQAENARLISDDFRPGCRVSLRGDHPHVRWVNSTYGIRAGHQATVIESMSDERYVSVVFDGSREVADILKSLFLPARRAALSPGGCDARQSQAASDVLAERRRQIESEGWTPEHDDTHRRGEMATAAACYAVASQMASQIYAGNEDFCDPDALVRAGTPPWVWPWGEAWWKPRNRRVALIKAGALIIAEIERLDRAALNGGHADG